MSRPIVPCDCASPAHCLEATGGEQGLTADELELVRLRGEVAELRRERDQFERAGAGRGRWTMTARGTQGHSTGADHVWEKRDGWDVCSRCGVAHSSRYIALTPCSVAPRDGEQRPTSDEREIDRLRLEVDRLRRLVTAAAAALDGLLTDVAAPGIPVHPLVVFALRRLARDLRAVLDQGAAR